MRGGARPGAGRKPGTTGEKTVQRLRKVEEYSAKAEEVIPEAFTGDAHAFLIFVYKNPALPMKDRLAAATAAAPYEKPKLAAVELSGNDEKPLVHEHHHIDATTFASRVASLATREGSGEGASGTEHRN